MRLVIVGHGSTVNPDSERADPRPRTRHPRAGNFSRGARLLLEGGALSLREILRQVESDEVFIVPNFISEGYFTRTVIPRELELEGPVTRRGHFTLKYCDPVGSHPGMTDALLHRAREAAPGVPLPRRACSLSATAPISMTTPPSRPRNRSPRIAALGEYAEVLSAYMEEAPLISDWDKLSHQPNVVVVPFFIADGLHSYEDIPVLLGIEASAGVAASQAEIFRRNPYTLRGRRLFMPAPSAPSLEWPA